jgi:hypothetical protein
MKKFLIATGTLLTVVASNITVVLADQTSNNVDLNVNLNQGPTKDKEPFGAFQLVKCDGPTLPPSVYTAAFKSDYVKKYGHEYIACDFRHLMQQAQFLINVMITLGVAVAIVGFAYAGWLYVTGVEKNITRAKGIFPKLGLGFILMLTAWFIVSQILTWLTGSSGYLTGN